MYLIFSADALCVVVVIECCCGGCASASIFMALVRMFTISEKGTSTRRTYSSIGEHKFGNAGVRGPTVWAGATNFECHDLESKGPHSRASGFGSLTPLTATYSSLQTWGPAVVFGYLAIPLPGHKAAWNPAASGYNFGSRSRLTHSLDDIY